MSTPEHLVRVLPVGPVTMAQGIPRTLAVHFNSLIKLEDSDVKAVPTARYLSSRNFKMFQVSVLFRVTYGCI